MHELPDLPAGTGRQGRLERDLLIADLPVALLEAPQRLDHRRRALVRRAVGGPGDSAWGRSRLEARLRRRGGRVHDPGGELRVRLIAVGREEFPVAVAADVDLAGLA